MNPEDQRERPGSVLDEMICFALYSAHHAMNRVYQPLLAGLGLTYPQYLVMRLLWEKNDRTVRELADLILLESNTLTPLLKRLEATGLVERARDAEDERKVRITLTPTGRRLENKARKVPCEISAASGRSDPDFRKLYRRIQSLRESLRDDAAGA